LVAIPASRTWWHNGALGAAWSLLVTEVIMAGAGLYLVRSSLDSGAIGRVARAALVALTMGLVVHAAAPFGLPAQLAIGLLIFAGLAAPLRLMRPHELALGRLYAGRLRTRLAALREG
jgi:hypothetical protein